MYLGEFYFSFPLYLVYDGWYPTVEDYVAVFTEQLHAERYCQGHRINLIQDLDDLEKVVNHFKDGNIGLCFDPLVKGGISESKLALPFDILQMAIDLEKIDPDGYVEPQ